jgi:hypothetical protein
MPRSLGHIIADSLQVGLAQAEKLLHGVTPEMFARFGRPGGCVVESNHAAFVLGHLSLYAPRIVEHLGGDAKAVAPPENFPALFSRDARCQDDPEGTIYPPMSEVTEAFFRGYRAALSALRSAPDDLFQQPNPLPGRLAELFPTLGSLHAFYVGGHLMGHLGQMSAWRRMHGLGPA